MKRNNSAVLYAAGMPSYQAETIIMQIGPEICVFKTHVDAFDSWDASIAHKLQELADKHWKPLLRAHLSWGGVIHICE